MIPIDPSNQPFAGQPVEDYDIVPGSDVEASPIDTDITTLPVYSETTTDMNLGRIGVVISGENIFYD